MPLSESLFDDLVPPEVWVTIGTLVQPEHDFVTLTVRVKEGVKRSVSAKVSVTRYAPTDTILLAASKALAALAVAQCPIDQALLRTQLEAAVVTWVDPF